MWDGVGKCPFAVEDKFFENLQLNRLAPPKFSKIFFSATAKLHYQTCNDCHENSRMKWGNTMLTPENVLVLLEGWNIWQRFGQFETVLQIYHVILQAKRRMCLEIWH